MGRTSKSRYKRYHMADDVSDAAGFKLRTQIALRLDASPHSKH